MDELIAADQVIGTDVFTAEGKRLGRIENIMIERMSGKSLYAMMSSGGFLGIGLAHYPLPWSRLHYDSSLHGYVVDLSAEQIERGRSDRYGHCDVGNGRVPDADKIGRTTHQIME